MWGMFWLPVIWLLCVSEMVDVPACMTCPSFSAAAEAVKCRTAVLKAIPL